MMSMSYRHVIYQAVTQHPAETRKFVEDCPNIFVATEVMQETRK
jgi:hypothetical protein